MKRQTIEMVEVWPGQWRSADEVDRKEAFLENLGPVREYPLPPIETPDPSPFWGVVKFVGGLLFIFFAPLFVLGWLLG